MKLALNTSSLAEETPRLDYPAGMLGNVRGLP